MLYPGFSQNERFVLSRAYFAQTSRSWIWAYFWSIGYSHLALQCYISGMMECGQVPLLFYTQFPLQVCGVSAGTVQAPPTWQLEGKARSVEFSFTSSLSKWFINRWYQSWADSKPFGSDWDHCVSEMAPAESIAAVVGAWKQSDHLLKQAALGSLAVVGPKDEGITRAELCTNVALLEPLIQHLGFLIALAAPSTFWTNLIGW